MTRAGWKTVIVAAALVAAFWAPVAGAEGELRLTEAGETRFPDRAYVLSLPSGMSLDESQVDVLENGELVEQLSVVPADEAAEGEFGTVLVIDASNSMQGAPIASAVEAARAFAAQRARISSSRSWSSTALRASCSRSLPTRRRSKQRSLSPGTGARDACLRRGRRRARPAARGRRRRRFRRGSL